MNDDTMSKPRDYLKQLATEQLRTKKALRAAVDGIIERMTSEEQFDVLNLAIIKAGLASNPEQFIEFVDGKWGLLKWVVDNPDKYRQLDDGRFALKPHLVDG